MSDKDKIFTKLSAYGTVGAPIVGLIALFVSLVVNVHLVKNQKIRHSEVIKEQKDALVEQRTQHAEALAEQKRQHAEALAEQKRQFDLGLQYKEEKHSEIIKLQRLQIVYSVAQSSYSKLLSSIDSLVDYNPDNNQEAEFSFLGNAYAFETLLHNQEIASSISLQKCGYINEVGSLLFYTTSSEDIQEYLIGENETELLMYLKISVKHIKKSRKDIRVVKEFCNKIESSMEMLSKVVENTKECFSSKSLLLDTDTDMPLVETYRSFYLMMLINSRKTASLYYFEREISKIKMFIRELKENQKSQKYYKKRTLKVFNDFEAFRFDFHKYRNELKEKQAYTTLEFKEFLKRTFLQITDQ
jgi:hypothetical protein